MIHPEHKFLCIVEDMQSSGKATSVKAIQVGSRYYYGREDFEKRIVLSGRLFLPCLTVYTYTLHREKRFLRWYRLTFPSFSIVTLEIM